MLCDLQEKVAYLEEKERVRDEKERVRDEKEREMLKWEVHSRIAQGMSLY